MTWLSYVLGVCTGILLAAAVGFAWPIWRTWRLEHVETQSERQQRRLELGLHWAQGLRVSGQHRQAATVMRLVLRAYPAEPQALHEMGQIQVGLGKPRAAREFFRRAYERASHSFEGHRTHPAHLAAEIAVDDAEACAMLRLQASTNEEYEQWTEALLASASRAAATHQDVAEELLHNPLFADLRNQIRRILGEAATEAEVSA